MPYVFALTPAAITSMRVQEENASSYSHSRYFFRNVLDSRIDALGKEYWWTVEVSSDQNLAVYRILYEMMTSYYKDFVIFTNEKDSCFIFTRVLFDSLQLSAHLPGDF